jgi:hypothetical protein
MDKTLYIIHWGSPLTGLTGHGSRGFPKHEAERYIEWNRETDLLRPLNERFSYWIEPESAEQSEETADLQVGRIGNRE